MGSLCSGGNTNEGEITSSGFSKKIKFNNKKQKQQVKKVEHQEEMHQSQEFQKTIST